MFALAAGLSILLVIALAAAMYIRAGVTPSTTDGEDRAAAGAPGEYAYGGVTGCPVGYSPVSKSGCTPGSIQIEGETFKSERRDETNQDYPMGCYTIKAGEPYTMYWNAATTSTAKDRGWEGFWDSVRRLCKRD